MPRGTEVMGVTVSQQENMAGEVSALKERVAALETQMAELADRFHDVLANLEVLVVNGYMVKAWPDLEADVWVAHCPTVRCVVQKATRSDAVAAIGESIQDMVAALVEMGEEPPPEDV